VNNCGSCGVSCGFGEACAAGKCTCVAGLATCGGSCVDPTSDPAHCGSCGQACEGAAPFCSTSSGATACAPSCAAGQTACGFACVDLDTNLFHCGACVRSCGSNEKCINQQCLADLYLACGDTDQLAEASADLTPAGTTHTVGTRPVSLEWLGGRLYSADSIGGSSSELRFDLPAPNPVSISRTFSIDKTTAFPDLEFVAGAGGLLYVSNAALGNLDVVDAASGAVIAATHLDPAGTDLFTSPAGIAVTNGKAYVALNGADAIAVVDVSPCQPAPPACAGTDCSAQPGSACVNGLCVPTGCGNLIKRIALPASLASAPTGPTPYRLLPVGPRLYVTLQNLDRANGFRPAGEGRLTAVDLSTDELVPGASGPLAISLGDACTNPGDLALLGDTLYVACGYFDFFGTKSKVGMAIVPVSLASGTPAPASAIPMEHALSPIASCGGEIFAGATDTGDVVRYAPATGQLSTATLCPLDSNGNAFVADLTCRPGL
jgi:DNA-binding beta-propeller fold protein YncE